jgi:hypothetical protein
MRAVRAVPIVVVFVLAQGVEQVCPVDDQTLIEPEYVRHSEGGAVPTALARRPRVIDTCGQAAPLHLECPGMDTSPAAQRLHAMAQLLTGSAADRSTEAVAAALTAAHSDLGRPMRLAITGQIKRGKSTLVNALTRMRVAATGVDEVTAAYHEFRFDGAPAAKPGPSAKRGKQPATVVATVAAALPPELRLIDTPGLSSPLVDTDGNAGLPADAALHLFENNVHQADRAYLRALLGRHGTAPLPARVLAVISACDLSWPPGQDRAVGGEPLTFDPLRDYAGPIIRQIDRNPLLSDLFFAVQPVAALVSEGGWTLTGDQIDLLADLASKCDEPTLAGHLESQPRFVAAETVADEAARRALLGRLGLWGIHLACQYLREPSADEAGLRDYLDERSGVARLRDTVVSHFVGRAAAIKLELHLRHVEELLADARATAQLQAVPMPAPLADIAALVETTRARSLPLTELVLVQLIHRQQHRLSDVERADLAALTGSGGAGSGPRLGLSADSGVDRMLDRAIELARRWSQRSPALPALGPVVVRAYEGLIDRISDAKSLLDSED